MTTAISLAARIVGVVRTPRATLEHVAAAPRTLDILVVTFVTAALSSALLLRTDIGRFALLDRWERTALAFGQQVDDARYEAMRRAAGNGAAYAVASASASIPLLAVVLSAVLVGAFRLTGRPGATYSQVLAVVSHAGVILALREVVTAPFVYARETLANPATLALFVPALAETSLPARFFGILDLFVLWWTVVLAVGLSAVYGTPVRRLALAFMGVYVLLAGVLAITMALAGGTA